MSAPRVWLIEALDGAGATIEDARIHARALASAGCDVRAFLAGASGLEEVTIPGNRAVSSERPDFALAASTCSSGGAAARHLPRGVAAGWWPTGLSNAPRWRFGRQVSALAFAADADVACAGLTASTSEAAPRRRAVPLWDGEVVLVPGALDRQNGAAILRSFESAAAMRSGLDLVVLGEPQPAFVTLARNAGVGARLHFVGSATREAEHAWLGSALALLVDADAALSGGLVLRALGRGVPIVPVGRSPASAALRAWLERCGCRDAETDDPVKALARALDHGPGAARADARGRSVAAEHDLAALGRRLAEVLEPLGARRAA